MSVIDVVNLQDDGRLRSSHRPRIILFCTGNRRWLLRAGERVAVEGMKELPLQPCVSCKLQEVACRLFPFYSFCFGTILRWKVVLKLELLQNTNVLRILQLRERSHARSRNVYSFQIGSFFFFFSFCCLALLQAYLRRRHQS